MGRGRWLAWWCGALVLAVVVAGLIAPTPAPHDPSAPIVIDLRCAEESIQGKALVYDGQGFWLCHKRLSSGRFQWWPRDESQASLSLAAHQLQVLLSAGNPAGTQAAPDWRPIGPRN